MANGRSGVIGHFSCNELLLIYNIEKIFTSVVYLCIRNNVYYYYTSCAIKIGLEIVYSP